MTLAVQGVCPRTDHPILHPSASIEGKKLSSFEITSLKTFRTATCRRSCSRSVTFETTTGHLLSPSTRHWSLIAGLRVRWCDSNKTPQAFCNPTRDVGCTDCMHCSTFKDQPRGAMVSHVILLVYVHSPLQYTALSNSPTLEGKSLSTPFTFPRPP